MSAILDYMRLCRLCLVKDKVNVPIFGEASDVRQIFLKITACLPVKVSEEDNLPKNICDSCLYKVDLLYQFWNTTVNAEKQLIQWLAEIGVDVNIKNTSPPNLRILPQSHAHPHSMPEAIILKEERPDPETKSMEQSQNYQDSHMYSDYEMRYQPQVNMTVGAPTDFSQPTDAPAEEEVKVPQQKAQPTKPTPAKRRGRPPKQKTPPVVKLPPPPVVPPAATSTATGSKRRSSAAAAAAAVAAAAANASSDESDLDDRYGGDDSDDEDMDVRIAKEEADSEDEEYIDNPESLEPTAFVGVPSTSACDSDQPGPSGLGGSTTTGKTSSALPASAANESGMCSEGKQDTEKDKSLICPDCYLLCRDRAHLKEHCTRYHNNAPAACTECGELFKIKMFLDHHYRVEHLKKIKYDCEVCGRQLGDKKTLKTHLLIHKNAYKFRCEQCNQGFFQKRLLEIHIRVKHEGFRYICFPCDKSYSDKTSYSSHMDSHNPMLPVVDLKIKCAYCNETFPSRRKLNSHRRIHYSYSKSCICDICGIRVSSALGLRQHKMRHNGESRFMCATCGKTHVTRTAFISHLRVHTQEKPYVCPECGKAFGQKNTLTCHKRLHTGERPFTCRICKKKFISNRSLKNHSKRHGIPLSEWKTGSKPIF